MRTFVFLFNAILLLQASPTFAEVGEIQNDPPIFLEGITVLATPLDEEDENTEPSHKTVIKGEALQERFTSIPEILSETVGVKVTRFGGLGDFSSISIRGSSSEQVLVYLDGFLLNSAQGGSVDLAKIPVSQIESIEVYRGSAPVLFGQTGIGGLVNIRTKEALHKKKAFYQFQYGSFNTTRLNTSLSLKPNETDFLIGLNYERSDNNFEFLNNNGTQFNSNDDETIKRKNAQFESTNLITKLGYDLSQKNKVTLHYNFLMTDKGVPGMGAFQSETANFKTETHRTSLGFEGKDLFPSKLDLKLELKYALQHEAFKDLEGDIGIGRQDNDNKTTLLEIAANFEQALGKFQTIKTRGQFQEQRFKPSDRLDSDPVGTNLRRVYSFALEDQIALFHDRIYITPSLLYDDIDNQLQGDVASSIGDQVIPSKGRSHYLTRQVGVFALVTEQLSLRVNIGRYFRNPSLFELFGDRGGTIGNTGLVPEAGLNRDIGLRYSQRFEGTIRKLIFQAAYFDNEAENLILFIQTSQFTARSENIAKSRIIGQEFSSRMEMGSHLKIEGSYTHQEAKNKSDIPNEHNKFLPGRPVHDLFGKAELYSERYAFYYSYQLTDKNFLDRDNQRNATTRQIHNIGFSMRPNSSWSVSFDAKNLGDDQIEDIFGFPLPGRSFFITLQGSI